MNTLRVIVAGIAGALAWYLGLLLFFGPAQAILSDPALQSPKFLAVFTQIEPLPRAATQPWLLFVGLAIIGVIYSAVFTTLQARLPGEGWRKGTAFGLIAWALMVPWFEFYLPYNVMHEPLALVLLEAVLWALVLQLMGITIATSQRLLTRRPVDG